MRPILLAFAAIAILGPAAAAAQGAGLSVADVIAKSDALEKKGMLAVFSSDVRVIKAEAQRDVDAFAGQLRSAHNAHRPLPACLPQDSSGWKLTFDTEEILKYSFDPAAAARHELGRRFRRVHEGQISLPLSAIRRRRARRAGWRTGRWR